MKIFSRERAREISASVGSAIFSGVRCTLYVRKISYLRFNRSRSRLLIITDRYRRRQHRTKVIECITNFASTQPSISIPVNHYISLEKMKSIIISFVAIVVSNFSSVVAFVPQGAPSTIGIARTMPLQSSPKLDMTPELEAAIADVREAASAFGEKTDHFANGEW